MKTFDTGTFYKGDCIEIMSTLPSASVDMILCDLPYGTTACSWDAIIPFEPLWEQYWRVLKPNRAVVLTASQPFTTALAASQLQYLKYEWIWRKTRATGHVHAKNKPMKQHENVLVFSQGNTLHEGQSDNRMPYYPQGVNPRYKPLVRRKDNQHSDSVFAKRASHPELVTSEFEGYPNSVLNFDSEFSTIHPTQKPVPLFEYLIRTYTNEGETVLDNTAGSGTTAIAAINSDRQWICIESDADIFKTATDRVNNYQAEENLSVDNIFG